MNIKKSCI